MDAKQTATVLTSAIAMGLLAIHGPAQDAASRPAGSPASAPATRPTGGGAPSPDAFKMGSPAGLQVGSQEEMWPAASAEGWKKPVLIRWQRTFDDALRAARAKQTPILVAVNMDGEIASEHYAGVRYREPATAELMNRYTCIVASVYRHTTRDFDEQGRRVICPRFGTVTCAEHIEAERELYDKYFEGKRISPRHIVLTLEGKKELDVYFSWDTATVFTTFREGMKNAPTPRTPHEGTLAAIVKSADVEDRERLEREYTIGTREQKRTILQALIDEPGVDQVDVLRSAVFGMDLELASLARRALAKTTIPSALDVIAVALQIPLEPAEKKLLLDNVAIRAKSDPRARTLVAVQSGLSQSSTHIDNDVLAREYSLDTQRENDRLASPAMPKDPGALLELAEAQVRRGQSTTVRRYSSLHFKDALAAALEAEKAGLTGPRVDAVVCVASAELGDGETARARAVAAVEGGLLKPGGADGKTGDDDALAQLTEASRVRLLTLFADARQTAIRNAIRARKEWKPEWLSDINAAYAVLAKQPSAEPATFVGFYDFLSWMGAGARANAVLDGALARFPEAAALHERHRSRLLWKGGADELESDYSNRLAALPAGSPEAGSMAWFAGYASLMAAEQHRRRGEFAEAGGSYGRAIALFQRYADAEPDGRDNAQHFIAFALAGQSRLAIERNDLASATRDLLAAIDARPDTMPALDGLGISPASTLLLLKSALTKAGDADRLAQLQKATDALNARDPRLLALPDSERAPEIGPQAGPARRGARGGQPARGPAQNPPPASRPATTSRPR